MGRQRRGRPPHPQPDRWLGEARRRVEHADRRGAGSRDQGLGERRPRERRVQLHGESRAHRAPGRRLGSGVPPRRDRAAPAAPAGNEVGPDDAPARKSRHLGDATVRTVSPSAMEKRAAAPPVRVTDSRIIIDNDDFVASSFHHYSKRFVVLTFGHHRMMSMAPATLRQ